MAMREFVEREGFGGFVAQSTFCWVISSVAEKFHWNNSGVAKVKLVCLEVFS